MPVASQRAFAEAFQVLEHQSALPGLGAAVEFHPEQLALRSRFRAAEAAAAALAAGAAVVGRIGAARGLEPARIRVASRHAEASLLSFAHLRFLEPDAAPPPRLAPEARTAVAGFHRTADQRWIYLHAGFPHNTQGLLTLLGVTDDRQAVTAAVAAWRGDDLEQAVAEAGLCGALVRSPEQWDTGVAGRLLAARPVVDIVQLDETDPEPFPAQPARALDGIRVLDLTRVLAGPACARTLASYGAQALQVSAPQLPSVPLFTVDTGFGKRATHLDLTRPADAQRLRRLARDADVFSQSYRTGALDRLGFGVADLVQLRPGIVYVSINCYGHDGPWRTRPGWEQLAQTVTGIAHCHGADTEAGKPALLPAAVTDYTTGYLAALGTVVALERRAREGGSYWVRVSLARTAMWLRSLGRRRGLSSSAFTADELSALQDRMGSSWGDLRFLRPAVSLSGQRVGWDLPPAPLGSHPPAFH